MRDELKWRAMRYEYYGATPKVEATFNRLLALLASGDEQDWEIELADPSKYSKTFNLLSNGSLNLEERCAVALLLTHTIDELCNDDADVSQFLPPLRSILSSDDELLGRMRFYWSYLQVSSAIKSVLR